MSMNSHRSPGLSRALNPIFALNFNNNKMLNDHIYIFRPVLEVWEIQDTCNNQTFKHFISFQMSTCNVNII